MARLNLRTGGGGWVSRVLMAIFGLVFFVAGWLAVWGVGQQVLDGARTWFWEAVPCTVESSEVVETGGDPAWRFEVTYRWRADGREHAGDRVWPGYQGSGLTAANGLALAYPPGRRTTCWIDPDEPAAATLERPAVWRAWILLLPWPFVGIGAFLLWMVFGGVRAGSRPAVPAATSADVDPGKAMGCGMAFFGVFLVAGLALFVPFFLVPAVQLLDARDWQEVPATIVSSHVASHDGDDGSTYSVEVVFRYEIDGRELRSDRYHFLGGSTSGYEAKAEVVRGLPPGAEVVAWVDPDNPGSAVLSRELRGEWLFGLLPLVFVAVGAGGMVMVWRGSRRLERREAAGIEPWMPDHDGAGAGEERYRRGFGADELHGDELKLEAQTTPLGKLGLTVFFAVVWNGIVGAFVWVLWNEYRTRGEVEGCLALFLVPFVLVGLLLLVSVPYQFLATFNPRPLLRLDRRLEPGAAADLSWSFEGRAGRIRRLTLTLTGEEKATYRRGTDTHTASETFFERVLYDSQAGMGVERASARLEIPADTMHSFAAPNNQVVWTLVVHGVIARWPDVHEQFPLVVHPKEVGP